MTILALKHNPVSIFFFKADFTMICICVLTKLTEKGMRLLNSGPGTGN